MCTSIKIKVKGKCYVEHYPKERDKRIRQNQSLKTLKNKQISTFNPWVICFLIDKLLDIWKEALPVLMICVSFICGIANYYLITRIKQLPFIILVSIDQKSRHSIISFSAQGLTRWKSKLQLDYIFIRSSGLSSEFMRLLA